MRAQLTLPEVAAIMTARGFPMGRGRAWQLEKSALAKLRNHPLIRELAEEAGIDLADRATKGEVDRVRELPRVRMAE